MNEQWQRELGELISIPSVSADPAHVDDVVRAGEWVCDFITRMGGEAAMSDVGDGQLAIGELRASHDADNAPTVVCYGHYDVQPPAPLEMWESDPFELSLRDGWAYGRGTTDDKGQLYILLKAAQHLVENDALPVNIRFACDGEEEIAGRTVVDWISNDDQDADAAIVLDGGMKRIDQPSFMVASRGTIFFDVKVQTGARDLHSGHFGGTATNATHVLMTCLQAVLAGPDGRLPEPLREGLVAPSSQERAGWATLPTGQVELASVGALPTDSHAADEFHLRTWAEPSTDVTGILGGKPGFRNATISARAEGQFTLRVAPGQDAELVGATAVALLKAAAPEGAEVEVDWFGIPSNFVDPGSAAVQLGLQAYESALGIRPLLTRCGGTVPILRALGDRGISTIQTGFGLPESFVHSPNERFLVRYFEQGVAALAATYSAFAELPRSS